MKLVSGKDVDVIGQAEIDGSIHLICKLHHATYIYGTLVRHIVLHQDEFQARVDQIQKETAEIAVPDTDNLFGLASVDGDTHTIHAPLDTGAPDEPVA